MGLKELEHNTNKRWSHPPKKKWIHCYMSVGEEKKSEVSELKSGLVARRGSGDPPLSLPLSLPPPFAPSSPHLSLTPTPPVSPLDRRGASLPPAPPPDDRPPLHHSHHRRQRGGHHPPSSPASPLLLTPPFSSSSSSSSSSVESPLGFMTSYKGNNNNMSPDGVGESSPMGGRGVMPMETSSLGGHLSLLESPPPAGIGGGRFQENGFLRPNGHAKPLSPLSRDLEDHYGKEDAKKRAGTTPSREVHNKLEKNRRAHLKECFETLRRQLPCMEDKKISNQTILKAAHRYIVNLKKREKEFESEMERLARQKINHQQQLSSLKKELQSKWDHIDFSAILPDLASLEQNREKETKSTTTASEQPDFEDDSRDSSGGHSNSLTITSSPEMIKSMFASEHHPVDLTPSSSSSNSECVSYTSSSSSRDVYQDPNQPLNLSTSSSTLDVVQKSPHRHPSPVRSPQQQQTRLNGEWPLRRNSHYVTSPYSNEEKSSGGFKPVLGRVHTPGATQTLQMTKISTSTSFPSLGVNVGRNQVSNFSTNASHISPMSVKGTSLSHVPVTSNSTATTGTHISQLVKPGTAPGAVSSQVAKVVTTFPNLTSLPQTGTTITHIPHHTGGSNIGHIHTISSSTASHHHNNQQQQHIIQHDPNIQGIPTTVAIGANLTHVPHLSTVCTTVARVSNAGAASNGSVTVGSHEHSLPIVGGNGIQLPAQLVASGVHLSGTSGTILGQPAIQVITPEGYKLLPADHAQNGAKPLAITLTHAGLEHLSGGEDGKSGPVMVAVSKNGLPALHLTMPASAGRALSNQIGNSVPVTSVPLNLTVGGSGTAVKVTQTGSTSLLPSYLPLTHANGITQLVQGMSLVGPLVVSQSQRGIMVPAGATAGKAGGKSQGGVPGTGGGGGANVPLVPAQYASTLAGGLVNSVVVVSAPTVVGHGGLASSNASVVTSTVGMQQQQQQQQQHHHHHHHHQSAKH